MAGGTSGGNAVEHDLPEIESFELAQQAVFLGLVEKCRLEDEALRG